MSVANASADSQPAEVVRVIIMGAGSSSSTPKMGCIAGPSPCATCAEARANPNSRNHRLNPSLLIQVRKPSASSSSSEASGAAAFNSATTEPYCVHTSTTKPAHPNPQEYLNILIDCGKTFRETSMRHFKALGVENLHAVLLTHDHADAAFGVDDLREFTGTQVRVSMPVYLDPRTDETMRRVFGYLYPKTAHNDGRWVASLEWPTFEQGSVVPVRVRGPDRQRYANPDDRPAKEVIVDLTLPVASVPIEHGPGYLSNGFVFELTKGHFMVYYSDISRFDEEDEARLRAAVGPNGVIEVIVLDMLSLTTYFSHFSRDQAIACAARIGAKRAYFVGMSHTLAYDKTNEVVRTELAKAGLVGELAFDGCVLYDALNTTTSVNAAHAKRPSSPSSL